MVVATAATMAIGEAKTDGSLINNLLKIALLIVVAVILIGAALWVYVLIKNWPVIKLFIDTMFSFLGGGALGWLWPFKPLDEIADATADAANAGVGQATLQIGVVRGMWGYVKSLFGFGD